MESALPLNGYFRYCRKILFDPGYFFREDFHRLSLASALTFGLVSAWVSSTILFFFNSLSSLALERIFRGWMEEVIGVDAFGLTTSEAVQSFLLQTGFLIVYPFFLLWYLSGFAGVLFLFSKIFIQDQSQLNYRSCLKILALALGSSWLVLIPIFGELIAFITFMILVVVGIREVFWVSTQRAALIVVAPQAVALIMLLLLLSFMAILGLVWANAFLLQAL